MIPKIIHYCWLSNDPIPQNLQECMLSWKRYLPDYEFILWNFDRFPKEKSRWVSEAFDNRKYAFAADYIRLYALYHYGGIYLDMDVEVIKAFDDLLDADELICYESNRNVFEMATIGASKGAAWVKDILDYYDGRSFILPDGKLDTLPLPNIAKQSLSTKYVFGNYPSKCNGTNCLNIYPSEYFSPKSYVNGKLYITENTYSIHHFEGSWLSEETRYIIKLATKLNFLPDKISLRISTLFSSIKFHGLRYTFKTMFSKIKKLL